MERRWSGKEILGGGEAAPNWLRIGLAVFSLVLIAQAAWILLSELQRPGRIRLPVDQRASLEAALERAPAGRAAKLGVVRGDLWAESAFTFASLLWAGQAAGPDAGNASVDEARTSVERALRYAPHRGDVWVLLAAMADRYNWQGFRPGSLLKMSYYTAPNEQVLFLPRIKVGLHAAVLQDPELADMVGRDIRLLVTRSPGQKPGLAAVYKAASGPTRQFVERVVSEIDPAYLADLRTGSP